MAYRWCVPCAVDSIDCAAAWATPASTASTLSLASAGNAPAIAVTVNTASPTVAVCSKATGTGDSGALLTRPASSPSSSKSPRSISPNSSPKKSAPLMERPSMAASSNSAASLTAISPADASSENAIPGIASIRASINAKTLFMVYPSCELCAHDVRDWLECVSKCREMQF